MRVNNILLNKAKRSGFLTKVEVISQQAAAQSDYQVQVEDIISRKGDGEDIQFFQKNGILNHWLESYASWKSDAWAKLPKLPVTKSQILKVLSGNPSDSIGSKTFQFFDDFESEKESIGIEGYYDTTETIPKAMAHGHNAIYDSTSNKTFFVIVDTVGYACVFYYDHDSTKCSSVIRLSVKASRDLQHGQPAITMDVNGHLWVFGGSHNTKCEVAKSDNARDISSWTAKADIGVGVGVTTIGGITYPQSIPTSAGGIIVIAREQQTGTWWDTVISQYKTTDDGASWTKTVIADVAACKHYPFEFRKIGGTIYGAVGPRNVGGDALWHGFFFMKSDDDGVTWEKADGTGYVLPVDNANADWITQLQDYHPHNINILPSGNPIVSAAEDSTPKKLHFYKWTGAAWNQYTVDSDIGTNCFSGANAHMKVISETSIDIYACIDIAGKLEIIRYYTINGGTNWNEVAITSGSTYHNALVDGLITYGGNLFLYWNYGGSSPIVQIKTYSPNITSPIPISGKWTLSNGGVNIADSIATIEDAYITTEGVAGSFSKPLKLRAKSRVTSIGAGVRNILGMEDQRLGGANDFYVRQDSGASPKYKFGSKKAGSSSNTITTAIESTNWHIWQMNWKTDELKLYYDDGLDTTKTNDIPAVDMCVLCASWDAGKVSEWDWIFIGECVSPEPLVTKRKISGKAGIIKAVCGGICS